MDVATLVITIVTNVVMLSGLAYLFYKLSNFPMEIGKRIRISKAHGAKMQQKLNDLLEQDVEDFIEQNPQILDIFPKTVTHAQQTQNMPGLVNTLVSFFAPAISSALLNAGGNSDSVGGNIAAQALTNPQTFQILGNILSSIRENAKKNYKKPETKEYKKDTRGDPGAPKAEGFG